MRLLGPLAEISPLQTFSSISDIEVRLCCSLAVWLYTSIPVFLFLPFVFVIYKQWQIEVLWSKKHFLTCICTISNIRLLCLRASVHRQPVELRFYLSHLPQLVPFGTEHFWRAFQCHPSSTSAQRVYIQAQKTFLTYCFHSSLGAFNVWELGRVLPRLPAVIRNKQWKAEKCKSGFQLSCLLRLTDLR